MRTAALAVVPLAVAGASTFLAEPASAATACAGSATDWGDARTVSSLSTGRGTEELRFSDSVLCGWSRLLGYGTYGDDEVHVDVTQNCCGSWEGPLGMVYRSGQTNFWSGDYKTNSTTYIRACAGMEPPGGLYPHGRDFYCTGWY